MKEVSLKILNLNASVDKWYVFEDSLDSSGVGRAKESFTFISGKGLNVARAMGNLGFQGYQVVHMVGGFFGEVITRATKDEGIPSDFFQVAGESRVNAIVSYKNPQTLQVFNEPGIPVTDREVDLFVAYLSKKICPGEQVILAGSTRPSRDNRLFTRVVDLCVEKGAVIQADIVGENLRYLIERAGSLVRLIKINNFEFQESFGIDPRSVGLVQQLLRERGIEEIIITLGSKGARYYGKDLLLEGSFTEGVEGTEGNPVGSGDSFLGGWLYGEYQGLPYTERLRLAMACGTANLLSMGPGVFSQSGVEAIERTIRIAEL